MGYVESEYIDQRLEEVAEGYMLCLVNRGFFRCIVRNGYTDEFMMPNLMHDLVLSIAGLKYKITTSDTNEFDESVCHVSFYLPEFTPWQAPPSLFKIKQLKSFLLPVPPVRHIRDFCQPVSVFRSNKMFISSFQSLRTLRMCGLKIDRLPNSLGKLIHLRYLDFSWNSICKLPDSVTQLANLYFLDLSNCEKLEELPEDISKLVMLRHLYLSRCFKLSHMPLELRRLVGLETLDYFVVGHKPRNTTPYGSNKAKPACSLADLGCLDNLKGVLTMVLADRSEDIVSEAKAANMDSKEITEFNMIFEGNRINDEMVLENLTPGADLEFLRIEKYGGKSLPSWMRERIHFQLPNLVSVEIVECKECIYMCSFGSLPNLQALILRKLEKVEYVELVPDEHSTCTSTTPLLLFPSLRHLHLTDMPRLKGWWGVTKASQDASLNHDQLLKQIPAFRKLESVKMNMELVISLLPQLFPQGNSSLQKLNVLGQTYGPSHVPAKRRQPVVVVPLQNYLPTLPELYLDDSEMEVVPEEFRGMTCLKRLYICNCEDLEEVPKWIDSFTSLEMLFIDNCPKLKSLPDEISNLSNLKSLVLNGCLWNLQKKMPQMASRLGGN